MITRKKKRESSEESSEEEEKPAKVGSIYYSLLFQLVVDD